jgi:outer membrane autotransporter protein
VINSVYDLSNDEAVRAIGSMTGVVHQHVTQGSLAAAQTFIDVNRARLAHVPGPAVSSMVNPALTVTAAAAPDANRQGAWFSGIGGETRLAGGDGDPAARLYDRGFAFGYDAAVGRHFVVGGSGGDTWPDLALVSVSDRASSRMRHGAGYTRYTRGASRVAVLAGGSRGTHSTGRSVTDGIGEATSLAEYHNRTLFSRVEYGYTFALGRAFSVEPQVAFQYARVTIDGFSEEGAGVLSLVAPDRRVTSSRSFLGGRAMRTFGAAAHTTLEVRGAWAHEFDPIGSARMRLSGDTAANEFDLTAPARFGDSALVGATFAGKAFRHLAFLTSVDGQVGGAVRMWTATAGIRAQW